mmetsp:Transcript_20040/g.57408  ORF Transcript_20040/g.57408 Transcript_20040/m.57408 type:complete len:203 (+) Transcript_20040:1868-2476(+)
MQVDRIDGIILPLVLLAFSMMVSCSLVLNAVGTVIGRGAGTEVGGRKSRNRGIPAAGGASIPGITGAACAAFGRFPSVKTVGEIREASADHQRAADLLRILRELPAKESLQALQMLEGRVHGAPRIDGVGGACSAHDKFAEVTSSAALAVDRHETAQRRLEGRCHAMRRKDGGAEDRPSTIHVDRLLFDADNDEMVHAKPTL